MTREELKAKVEEVAKDKAFVKNAFETESAEDAQNIFTEKNINLSVDKNWTIAKSLIADEKEMNEKALENVSGGIIARDIWKILIPGPFPKRPLPPPLHPKSSKKWPIW